jgi:hypothetical protein
MFTLVADAILDGLQGGLAVLALYFVASTVRDILLVVTGKH